MNIEGRLFAFSFAFLIVLIDDRPIKSFHLFSKFQRILQPCFVDRYSAAHIISIIFKQSKLPTYDISGNPYVLSISFLTSFNVFFSMT